jgi:hypothetical protein
MVRASLTARPEVAIVPGSIPASSDTVESEGAADEAVLNKVQKRIPQKFLKKSTFNYQYMALYVSDR